MSLYMFVCVCFQVYKFVNLSELYYAGSHGMDIKGPVKGHNYEKVNTIN